MIKFKSKFKTDDLDNLDELDGIYDSLEAKLKEGVEYTIYLMDKKKNRTLSANRYYFGVVLKTISDFMGNDNLDITIDDLHEALKGKFNSKVVLINGEAYDIGESTKKLSQDDFIKYIEEIREWSLDTLNCYIPTPQEVVETDFSDLYVGAYHNFPSK